MSRYCVYSKYVAMSLLPSPRVVGRVICNLYRSGNTTSPQLTKVRSTEELPLNLTGDVYPPPYTREWDQGKFPGISTFDAPFYTTGRLWAYATNYSIPQDLMVYNDVIIMVNGNDEKIRHWSWLPDVVMKPAHFLKLIGDAGKRISPPLPAGTLDSWILLPKNVIPPPPALKIIPRSIAHTAQHILQALAQRIKEIESEAVNLGESDEALDLCEQALWLRNWYHAYLDSLMTPNSFVPTLTISGFYARSYHTSAHRSRVIPNQYLPYIHAYVYNMRKYAKQLHDRGEEDEAVDLCDQLMWVENAAMTGMAP